MNRQEKPNPGATEGEWWRFSLYEIRDGCIQPAEGAKLESYDPWPDFQGSRNQTVGQAPTGVQPAYQSLMNLVRQLEYLPGSKGYPDCLTENSQALILEWCQQYGLLGVLLSRWEAISLAPQLDPANDWVQQRYFRGFGQAVQIQTTKGDDVEERTATVLIRGLNDFALAEESPSKTWSRFFPGIERSKQDSFIYPPPYTVEFCYLYGERLSDFCNAAKLLVGAMSILGQQPTKMKRDPLACQQAFDTINLLRRPVASVLALEESAVNHRRVAPSLLASFADMFAQDLVYRLAIRQCGCCGTLFVSSAYQAKYCKESCRLRDQKRRLRAQMKQAKDLRAKGQSLKKIAGSVGHPPKRVKRWLANA